MARSEQQLENRIAVTADLVLKFNTKFKDSVVYLKLIEDSAAGAFQIHFGFKDPLVQSEIYDRGNAIIYPSDLVYKEIQKLAGKTKVSWNNTGSIGWLSL